MYCLKSPSSSIAALPGRVGVQVHTPNLDRTHSWNETTADQLRMMWSPSILTNITAATVRIQLYGYSESGSVRKLTMNFYPDNYQSR